MLKHLQDTPAAPSRVVVLGAGGFVGRYLLRALEAARIPKLALGRQDIELAEPRAIEMLAATLRSDDAVVLLSAITPDKGRGVEAFQANIAMSAHLCQALARAPVAQVVYFSSDAVYPFGDVTSERSGAQPLDLYGAMHLSRELMLSSAARAPLAILRPTLIYGAGDTHNSYGVNRFIRSAQREGRIVLFGEGEETRDHIAVEDVVEVALQVLRRRSVGVLNVVTGASISYADLARRVASLADREVKIETSPRQNPITHRRYDIAALREAFPQFTPTPLERSLPRTWAAMAGSDA